MTGLARSPCLPPCLATRASVRAGGAGAGWAGNTSALALQLQAGLHRTRHAPTTPRLAAVLSIAGSGFGLWLGLNLPRILHHMYTAVTARLLCINPTRFS